MEQGLDNLNIDDEEMVDNTPVFCDELKGIGEEEEFSMESLDAEENEDYTIHPTDSMILTAVVQEELGGNLEVYIFDEINQNLYVHHDIMLSSFPWCIEWIPQDWHSNSKANYAAIGSFNEEIEIWDIDVLDAIDPVCVLGNISNDEKYFKQFKKKSKKSTKDMVHTGGVLSLSLNPYKRFDFNKELSGIRR